MVLGPKIPPEPDRRVLTRRDRLRARYVLWAESSLPRVRGCGKRIRSGEGVAVLVSGVGSQRRAGIGGVATCGSVWVCPSCAAKISAHRQGELEALLSAWHNRGGRVGLLTLTMRHRNGWSLVVLWAAVSMAWARVTSGRAWMAEQRAYGVECERLVKSGRRRGQTVSGARIHFARVVEVTHGVNGWHVHLHVLLFLAPEVSSEAVKLLGDQMFTRWRDSLVAQGLGAPSWRHGVDCSRLEGDDGAVHLSDYFTKANYSASMEVARSDLKDARGGNRTPFAILRGVVDGDADDLDLWHEWEKGSHGRRQLLVSHGLRELLIPQVEDLDDDTIAAAREDGAVVAEVDAVTWHWIVARRALGELLEVAESDDDGTELRAWLVGASAAARGRPAPPTAFPLFV